MDALEVYTELSAAPEKVRHYSIPVFFERHYMKKCPGTNGSFCSEKWWPNTTGPTR